MSTSDIIQLVGIMVSAVCSLIAIIISVRTLKQNNKMIEESTRPYILIYGKTANFQDPRFYLILKNFGSSGATITNYTCDYDLSKFSYKEGVAPFQNICKTFIAPGQSFVCNLNVQSLFRDNPIKQINFHIEYTINKKIYKENCSISLNSYTDLVQSRSATKDKELRNISYTLQDLVEKQL